MIERSPRAPVLHGLAGNGAPSKRLEILKQAAPRISRVGFLWNPNHPDNELPEAERAAASLFAVGGQTDFDTAFAAATNARIDALYVVTSRLTLQNSGGAAKASAMATQAIDRLGERW